MSETDLKKNLKTYQAALERSVAKDLRNDLMARWSFRTIRLLRKIEATKKALNI